LQLLELALQQNFLIVELLLRKEPGILTFGQLPLQQLHLLLVLLLLGFEFRRKFVHHPKIFLCSTAVPPNG